ncbi:MAG: hypothetical protein EOP48_21515 [Sphingobacteriales bacterium]|nr:MAG: hypothetical protein EOP48_21515 [Sphingobacteriales bacterium]
MPLTRSSEQKRQTLEEFYSEWASSKEIISSNIGKTMLSVIERVNSTFLETKIYGLTSHAHLTFRPDDSNGNEWYVAIIANADEYHIEYRMTKDKRPWKDATVKGATKSLDEFMTYIIIAMTESGVWSKSEELKRLYKKVKSGSTDANA